MLPEVEQFTAAMRAATEKWNAACAALEVCDWSLSVDKCPHCIAVDAHWDEYESERNAAWEALKGSRDPLVAWIAKNCREHSEEAQIVLRALPASMDELDALAFEKGWCGAWRGYVVRARAADVLPQAQPEASGR